MKPTELRQGLRAFSGTVKRSVVAAFVVVIAVLVMGAGIASADTHTGFVLTVTCGSTTTTVVSPTDPAAASQDVSSTGVIILAYGAIHAPSSFPSGKVVFCDLVNLTTGHSFQGVPFLIQGAP
jgi:hypothetical protein